MKLKYITLTGADDSIDPKRLIELSYAYPNAEWGILFSPKRQGTGRYPSMTFIRQFLGLTLMTETNVSFHLCGDYTRSLMKGDASGAEKIINLASEHLNGFRVQINFNATESRYDIGFISEWIRKTFTEQWVKHKTVISFILQFNNSNDVLCRELIKRGVPGINFLYDASGGRGETANNYSPVFPNILTGYAGGLSPDNLKAELKKITSAVTGNESIWIDAESGLRTDDDKFDLVKVEQFLKIARA